MLKIGSVKWKGRCSRHSAYDPQLDGPGAIKGGCKRCQMLYEIWAHHQRMVHLIREFGHGRESPAARASSSEGRQLSLLD